MFKLSTTALAVATILAVMAPVRTAPLLEARAASGNANSLVRQNALQAQQLNVKFSSIKASDRCQGSEQACVNGAFAQCVQGKWTVHAPCAGNLQCFALPLVLKEGVSLVCDTPQGAERRFQDAGVSGGTRGSGAAPAPVEDEEIEDCEEEDELEGRLFAEDDDYHYFYKRQVTSNDPVTFVEIPLPTVASSVSSVPTAIVTSSSSSVAAATPTIVIGNDGIVTVTVVSTVFASPTACANSISVPASSLPTPISVSRAPPLSSSSIPASVRPTAFPSSASIPRASNVISLSAASTAASPSSSSSVVKGGGFSFTFARRAMPTPVVA